MVHVVSSSTPLVFPTNMSEKCQSTSPSPIQIKIQQKTISIEEKLCVINQLKKVNNLFTYAVILRPAHCGVNASQDYANRFKESAKSGTKVTV